MLNLIPEDTYFDMMDHIVKVKEKGLQVDVYPISEKAWTDMGQCTEYRNTFQELDKKND